MQLGECKLEAVDTPCSDLRDICLFLRADSLAFGIGGRKLEEDNDDIIHSSRCPFFIQHYIRKANIKAQVIRSWH